MTNSKDSSKKGAAAIENGTKRLCRCVTMDQHWRLVRKDPEYRWRRLQIEREIQEWVKRYSDAGLRSGLIRIPIVVHVIYNTAGQNISDAQIQSQINALNADFRRLNTDASSTPLSFLGVAADARLEFDLAVRDPDCNPTTGITRTQTSVSGWVFPGDGMKSAATGGHDPWDVTKYLNVWVINYTDGNLGYATFPGQPANIQGVVCDYRAFGTIGALKPHAALGRTMTHEIGHWLNLYHIWGNDGLACTGSDNVADTPNQAGESPLGPCRAFPSVTCMNGPDGDMFMNYMDYSGDECMNIFTVGQVARMDAALYIARASILSSDGLVPAEGNPQPDLWMKDVSDDFGTEPDTSAQPMYISDDIWVRKANDGLLNQDHQNPEYRPPGSPSNYVYVRVRNRGCSGTSSGLLKLYWAKASTSLSWPSPWDGSVTMPALMGGPISSQSVSVAAGDDEILIFPWMPPNPADYASFGADQSHFCLLARIETSTTSPYGMTFTETSDLYSNVKNNNNIVWKNITVVDDVPGSGRFASVIVANFSDKIEQATLDFMVLQREIPSIFEWGQVFVELPQDLVKQLTKDGNKNDGVRQFDDKTFQIIRSGATLGTFKLSPGKVHVLHIRFAPVHTHHLGVHVFTLDLIKKVNDHIIGGQRFVVKNLPDFRYISVDKPITVFDGVTWVSVSEGKPGFTCCCS